MASASWCNKILPWAFLCFLALCDKIKYERCYLLLGQSESPFMCTNSFDIVTNSHYIFLSKTSNVCVQFAWELSGNMANGRKCQILLFTHATIFFLLTKLPPSHLYPLTWHSETDQLQLPLLLFLYPCNTSPWLCVCVWFVTPQRRPESVSCRVGWRAKVMKHSPVDILGQWSMSSSFIWLSFNLLKQPVRWAAGQKQAASKLPNCPWCVNNTSTPVTPLRWGTWFL